MKSKRPQTTKRTARTATTKRAAASTKTARPIRAKTAPKRIAETKAEAVPTKSPAPRKKLPAPAERESAASTEPVIDQIRELEAQLDRLLDHASRPPPAERIPDVYDGELELTQPRLREPDRDPEGLDETRVIARGDLLPIAPSPPPAAPIVASSAPARPAPRPSPPIADDSVFDTARELLTSDFYLRKWGRLAMRGRSEQVDDFGFDPIYDEKARGILAFLYRRYFRVTTTGLERVPAEGRCLLVVNHSGTIPLDGLMLKAAVKFEHPAPRDVRWLTEDFIHHMPYLGSTMNRLGAVRACQENAERLLAKEQLCAVFPEGLKGIGKLFSERYRLQRFGRGGFIKLCLRTNTPIIPVAIVGAEETNPLLFKIEYLSRALGLPYVPVTPTFPALGPLGLLPAPTKWQIHFGEMLDFGSYGREAADDDLLVGRLAERVRATIQGMLDRAVATRKSVFFG